jgi:Ca-activated chloride channel family protein
MIRFEQPAWLWLLLLLPAIALAWGRLPLPTVRRSIAITLRCGVIAAIAAALADPSMVRRDTRLSVVAVLDMSGSVRELSELAAAPGGAAFEFRELLARAAAARLVGDEFGLVVAAREPEVISMPISAAPISDGLDRVDPEGTDLAAALRLARSILPEDRGGRLLLVSDGIETRGDAESAARAIAAGVQGGLPVPIDVMPVPSLEAPEIRVSLFEAPARASAGETVPVSVSIESTLATRVRAQLRRDGRAVPGWESGIEIEVPAGGRIDRFEVPLGSDPVQRLEFSIDPLLPGHDRISRNNRAEAVVVCPGRQSVLLVREAAPQPGALGEMLREAGMPLRIVPPESVPADLLSLQGWDLVILEDLAGHRLPKGVQENLARHVETFGGGLLKTGGRQAFAAGGWHAFPLAEILPVRSELPRSLAVPDTAVVFVIDRSGSMRAPVAGARATQQQVANEATITAIESLGPRTLVAVVAFDHAATVVLPLTANDQPESFAARLRAISPDGGTDIGAGLAAAEALLAAQPNLERKIVVCLSDGVDRDPDGAVAISARLASGGAIVHALGIGDSADHATLAKIAEVGEGRFWEIRDPRRLPEVMVESVRVVNAPLIREESFDPQVRPTGSVFSEMLAAAPPLRGVALSSMREEPTVVHDATTDRGEPLLARWQAGLGRVAAFTSAADGPWAGEWRNWRGRGAFWVALCRWLAREQSGAIRAEARIDGDAIVIEAEVSREEGVARPRELVATIHGPEGTRERVALRPLAPGRFRGEGLARSAGAYLVGIVSDAEAALPPAIAAATRSESEEFSGGWRGDPSLLGRIAAISGGRELPFPLAAAEDRTGEKLFDPRERRLVEGWRELWPWLLWAAIPLFWIDVANRRIAWDPAAAARAVASPFHRRGGHPAERAMGSLAAARRAKASAARRIG